MPPKASKRKAANGYRLPDPLPEGLVFTDILKKTWRLGKSIGVGGFGEIYLCIEDKGHPVGDDAAFVVKIEPQENGPLFVEMNFYIRAAKPPMVNEFKSAKGLRDLGMPTYQGSGRLVHKGETYRFLVIERFGKDLQKIFLTGKKLFPAKATYNLAIKMLDVIEYIHYRGYVHNDLKAQNILLGHGRTKENDAFLVDFGLVTKYVHDGVHKEYKPDARKAHDGTIEYTSRDAHIGAHSRRSDLEILGYNLVHWMSGTLPWMDNLTDCQYVHLQKKGFMSDIPKFLRCCFGENDYPDVLEEFMTYVTGLGFEVKPDYDACREMFRQALKDLKLPLDGKIDFSNAKSPTKKVRKSPMKQRKSPTKKRADPVSDDDDDDEGGSPVKSTGRKRTARGAPAKAGSPAKAAKVTSVKTTKAKASARVAKGAKSPAFKEAGSQTSPAFIKTATAAARKRKAAAAAVVVSDDSETGMFVEKAISAAKKANARLAKSRSPSRSPSPKKKASVRAKPASTKRAKAAEPAMGDNGFDNPTPAMLAILKQREESAAKKKSKKK